METFTALKDFVNNPQYHKQRQVALSKLDINTLDPPIRLIIEGLSKLPYCFTLQSCYGHFLYQHQRNPESIEPLPISESITRVEYRIAYIALCLQDSESGRRLFHDLSKIPERDSEYIQFGCAEWFWKSQVNTYALQVEPKRYMTKDKISVNYQEALHIEKTRNVFFNELKRIIQERKDHE
jgi:hypothetical protein